VIAHAVAPNPQEIAVTVGARLALPPGLPAALERGLCRTFTAPDGSLAYYDRGADGGLRVPRGGAELVAGLCARFDLRVRWQMDLYASPAPVEFGPRMTLTAAQERAVQAMLTLPAPAGGRQVERKMGVLEAPAGSGKTVLGLALIARRRQPALWLTHTKELLRQTRARAVAMLGLTEGEIGVIGDGERRPGERLTIALVQTLARDGGDSIPQGIGHLVVDEVHHVPAVQMSTVVQRIPARYLLGLTATAYRSDGRDEAITYLLGPIVHTMHKRSLADRLITPAVFVRETGYRPAGMEYHELVTSLIESESRTALIARDVALAVQAGRRCLVLSDRVAHVQALAEAIEGHGVAAAMLYGALAGEERERIVAELGAGELAVVVATSALVAEGFDSPALDALFLATPMSFRGRVIQAVGRVSRTAPGKEDAVVFDYVDRAGYLQGSFHKRLTTYRSQGMPVYTAGRLPS
jgi:superfamily II DNA or RNA helicase